MTNQIRTWCNMVVKLALDNQGDVMLTYVEDNQGDVMLTYVEKDVVR